MNKVPRIGDVAAQFNISSRTLRYYDAEALRRLEQILLLRRLELPVKEICDRL